MTPVKTPLLYLFLFFSSLLPQHVFLVLSVEALPVLLPAEGLMKIAACSKLSPEKRREGCTLPPSFTLSSLIYIAMP